MTKKPSKIEKQRQKQNKFAKAHKNTYRRITAIL